MDDDGQDGDDNESMDGSPAGTQVAGGAAEPVLERQRSANGLTGGAGAGSSSSTGSAIGSSGSNNNSNSTINSGVGGASVGSGGGGGSGAGGAGADASPNSRGGRSSFDGIPPSTVARRRIMSQRMSGAFKMLRSSSNTSIRNAEADLMMHLGGGGDYGACTNDARVLGVGAGCAHCIDGRRDGLLA